MGRETTCPLKNEEQNEPEKVKHKISGPEKEYYKNVVKRENILS